MEFINLIIINNEQNKGVTIFNELKYSSYGQWFAFGCSLKFKNRSTKSWKLFQFGDINTGAENVGLYIECVSTGEDKETEIWESPIATLIQ